MRTKNLATLFLIYVMALGSILWATHAGFTESAISTSADGARSVHAADVDGDGDMDVLSASYGDDTIAWYENLTTDGCNSPVCVYIQNINIDNGTLDIFMVNNEAIANFEFELTGI